MRQSGARRMSPSGRADGRNDQEASPMALSRTAKKEASHRQRGPHSGDVSCERRQERMEHIRECGSGGWKEEDENGWDSPVGASDRLRRSGSWQGRPYPLPMSALPRRSVRYRLSRRRSSQQFNQLSLPKLLRQTHRTRSIYVLPVWICPFFQKGLYHLMIGR